MIMGIAVSQLTRLGALALRLRSRTRYQTQQHRTLMTLASRLPPTMLLELDDPHGDGTQLRLRTADHNGQERHVRG
jgi:hypothetical protein